MPCLIYGFREQGFHVGHISLVEHEMPISTLPQRPGLVYSAPMSRSHQIFLLSPAHCSGKRAGFLLRNDARSALAQRLRSGEGATIGEVYTFMSGLYFRGKLAYARAFADPPGDCSGIQVIVPGLGLRPPDAIIDINGLRAIARVPVDPDVRRYTQPLRRDAAELAERLSAEAAAVLLAASPLRSTYNR